MLPRSGAPDTLPHLTIEERRGSRLTGWIPVLLALPLYAVALGWGWGPEHLWAWDEPRPAEISASPYSAVTSWPVRYPLLHRDLLHLVFSVTDPAARVLGADSEPSRDHFRFLTGRAVSVLLALLTVRLAFLVASRGRSHRAGGLAALVWIAVLPQTYYAKTMNLDAPYLFWFALAAWGFVRLREEPRMRFAALFFGSAAAAVLTKDQAFGLFVLPALFLLAEAARARKRDLAAPPVAILLGIPALGAVAMAACSYRLATGSELLRLHLAALLAHPSTYAFSAPDLASGFARWQLGFRHVVWSFGSPLAAVIGAGIALALVRWREAAPSGPRSSVVLLLFPISYILFALVPLGYHYDRFLLPVCWTLSVVAGGALAEFWDGLAPGGARALVVATIAAALSWGLFRCVILDRAMSADRRQVLEAATRGLPRATLSRFAVRAPQGFDRLALPPTGDLPISALSAYGCVAIPAADSGDRQIGHLLGQLAKGACGFRRTNPELSGPSPLRRWVDFSGVLSNLSEVDPPILVFRRRLPLAPCPDEAAPGSRLAAGAAREASFPPRSSADGEAAPEAPVVSGSLVQSPAAGRSPST